MDRIDIKGLIIDLYALEANWMLDNPAMKEHSIDMKELTIDPYPTWKRFQKEAPVAWVPAMNRYLVTRSKDIRHIEAHPEIFSSEEEGSLMIRAMGQNMMRKDGKAHNRERMACAASVRPPIIKNHWTPEFQRIVNTLINGFVSKGKSDLFRDFASPCAGLCLRELLGLKDSDPRDLAEWSQAMIDATGNYADNPEMWARADRARAGTKLALEKWVPFYQQNPDHSMISSMLHADDPLSFDEIWANVNVIIGGGLNEPRDAILSATYALLSNPDQRKMVEEDASLWERVFEETVRWQSPIGMYPRITTKDTELAGVKLKRGARIGVVVAAACREDALYENADEFDLTREKAPHLAFGAGPHFCLGTFVARKMVGEVALPTLFSSLKNLRLDENEPVRYGGWVFRGPLNMPVKWDND